MFADNDIIGWQSEEKQPNMVLWEQIGCYVEAAGQKNTDSFKREKKMKKEGGRRERERRRDGDGERKRGMKREIERKHRNAIHCTYTHL